MIAIDCKMVDCVCAVWGSTRTWPWNWPLCDSITFTLDPDNVDPQQSVERLQRHAGHFWVFVLWMQKEKYEPLNVIIEISLPTCETCELRLLLLFSWETQIKHKTGQLYVETNMIKFQSLCMISNEWPIDVWTVEVHMVWWSLSFRLTEFLISKCQSSVKLVKYKTIMGFRKKC